MGAKLDAYRVLVGRLEEKKSLERSGCRWKIVLKRIVQK
jgi:hypothetical protein